MTDKFRESAKRALSVHSDTFCKLADAEPRPQQFAARDFVESVFHCAGLSAAHSIRVGDMLQHYIDDDCVIAAAYLHDIVEDTPITIEIVHQLFGHVVSDLVQLLTDKPGVNRKERQLQTYSAIATSARATLIKLADRLDNIERSLPMGQDPSEKKLQMYINEYALFKKALYREWNSDVGDVVAQFWTALDASHLSAKNSSESL